MSRIMSNIITSDTDRALFGVINGHRQHVVGLADMPIEILARITTPLLLRDIAALYDTYDRTFIAKLDHGGLVHMPTPVSKLGFGESTAPIWFNNIFDRALVPTTERTMRAIYPCQGHMLRAHRRRQYARALTLTQGMFGWELLDFSEWCRLETVSMVVQFWSTLQPILHVLGTQAPSGIRTLRLNDCWPYGSRDGADHGQFAPSPLPSNFEHVSFGDLHALQTLYIRSHGVNLEILSLPETLTELEACAFGIECCVALACGPSLPPQLDQLTLSSSGHVRIIGDMPATHKFRYLLLTSGDIVARDANALLFATPSRAQTILSSPIPPLFDTSCLTVLSCLIDHDKFIELIAVGGGGGGGGPGETGRGRIDLEGPEGERRANANPINATYHTSPFPVLSTLSVQLKIPYHNPRMGQSITPRAPWELLPRSLCELIISSDSIQRSPWIVDWKAVPLLPRKLVYLSVPTRFPTALSTISGHVNICDACIAETRVSWPPSLTVLNSSTERYALNSHYRISGNPLVDRGLESIFPTTLSHLNASHQIIIESRPLTLPRNLHALNVVATVPHPASGFLYAAPWVKRVPSCPHVIEGSEIECSCSNTTTTTIATSANAHTNTATTATTNATSIDPNANTNANANANTNSIDANVTANTITLQHSTTLRALSIGALCNANSEEVREQMSATIAQLPEMSNLSRLGLPLAEDTLQSAALETLKRCHSIRAFTATAVPYLEGVTDAYLSHLFNCLPPNLTALHLDFTACNHWCLTPSQIASLPASTHTLMISAGRVDSEQLQCLLRNLGPSVRTLWTSIAPPTYSQRMSYEIADAHARGLHYHACAQTGLPWDNPIECEYWMPPCD